MQRKTFDISSFKSRLEAKNQFDGNLRFGAKKFHKETNRSGEGKPADGGLVREHAKIVKDNGHDCYQRIGEFWEDVNECPVCQSAERSFFLARQGLDIWRCNHCSHRYQHPRISFEKASELYSDDKTSSDIYTQPIQKDIDRIKYQYGIDLIDQLNPPARKRMMDIGCGAGVFLEVASSNGWDTCVGIDANNRYAEIYQEASGIQFIQSSFESLNHEKLGTNYDCITLWNVLEHLFDLHSIIMSIKKMLKPGGLLFIMVPNVESMASRLIRDKSATFNWKHVCHFSVDSLKKLMELHELKCVHMETAISEIDNVKSYMNGEYPYHGHGDPDGLYDFITPEYLHRNLLGSRLVGIFKNA